MIATYSSRLTQPLPSLSASSTIAATSASVTPTLYLLHTRSSRSAVMPSLLLWQESHSAPLASPPSRAAAAAAAVASLVLNPSSR